MNQWGFWCLFGVYSYEIPCNRMKYRKTHKVRERALLHGFSCYEISQKTSQPLSNPVSRSTSEWTAFHPKSPAEWLGISHTAPSFLLLRQKVTASGSPVRLQWLVKPPRPSRRLAVATNFLRICALRRWRFILSHPYNKKSIVRVSVRCSFFIPSARELESFRFRMPTGGPTKGRGLLHNV